MKISVVVANHNYEQFLEECVESVLAQRGVDVELIIVDDGSSDNSREVMRRYEDRAKVLFKANGGQASAFNYAYPHCTGDLVHFLDADDVLNAGALEKIAAVWSEGVSKVHFALEVIDERGERLGTRVPRAALKSGDLRTDVLSRGIYISPPSSGNVFSRRYLDAVMPMPETGWTYADAYLICQAPLYGEVIAVEEPLGRYRRHTASSTDVSRGARAEVRRKLETMIETDLNIRAVLERQARELGFALSPAAVVNHWLHLKATLALLKLRQIPAGAMFQTTVRFLRALGEAPELSYKTRGMLMLWAMAVAVFPLRWAEAPIRYGFAAGNRRASVRRKWKGWKVRGFALAVCLGMC